MAELKDKDLEQVDGAGFFDIVKKIGEGQLPGYDGQIRDIDLAEVDGGTYGRQVDIDNAGIGGGQKDSAVWIGGATNPIAGATDGFYFDPDDSLGNPS